MSSYQYMVNGVLSEAENNVEDKPELKELLILDNDVQDIYFKLIWKAFKNVIQNRVLNNLDLQIPYIGRILIKWKSKIANEIKVDIAKEFGYISFNDIPKDKIDNAHKILKKRLSDKIDKKRKNLNIGTTKVFKIKLKDIVQNT